MARITSNDLIEGLSGKLGDSLVFRTIRGKTFVTTPARKPNKKKESEAQRNTRTAFKKASEWAQGILFDPEKKAYYQKRAKALNLPNAYTAALTDYMRKPKVEKLQYGDKVTYTVKKRGFTLPEVRVSTSETTDTLPNVVVRQQKDGWMIHCRDTALLLTFTITDNTRRTTVVKETAVNMVTSG